LSTPYLPVMEKYTKLRGSIFKKSGHVRLGYELKFFESIKEFKIRDKWFINKGRINQLISIKLFTLLPSFFYYMFLSPLYRILTILMYIQDKYGKGEGADMFLVMQKT
jgi:hypothetical protein